MRLTKAQRAALELLSTRPKVSYHRKIRRSVYVLIRLGLASKADDPVSHVEFWQLTDAGKRALHCGSILRCVPGSCICLCDGCRLGGKDVMRKST